MSTKAVSAGVVSLVIIVMIIVVVSGSILSTQTQKENLFTSSTFSIASSTASNSSKSNLNKGSYWTGEEENSTSGLRLSLSIAPLNGSARTLIINVDEFNTLSTMNNLSSSNDWMFDPDSLNPYNPCGSPGPVGFEILQGYYDSGNYSSGEQVLAHDNSDLTYMCTMSIGNNAIYSFSPQSDRAVLVYSSFASYSIAVSLSL